VCPAQHRTQALPKGHTPVEIEMSSLYICSMQLHPQLLQHHHLLTAFRNASTEFKLRPCNHCCLAGGCPGGKQTSVLAFEKTPLDESQLQATSS